MQKIWEPIQDTATSQEAGPPFKNSQNEATLYRSNLYFATLPFRAPVVVVALNCCCGFLEADVVESSKGSAADVLYCVVWDQKLLLRPAGEKDQHMH